MQRCFSHRRSFSHGTQNGPQSEEKKVDDSSNNSNGNSHKQSGSNSEDVLIFGIAAHTNFV
jgi:hypothetical protein